MRHIISFIFLVCICFSTSTAKSQSFGDIGTQWYFTQFHFLDAGIDYIKIESIGDTMINGQICHHLRRHGYDCSFTDSDVYIYEENNIVYYFLTGTNQFSPLYNFNLQQGDTMKGYVFAFGNIDSFMMKITSVWFDTINEIPLKKFVVENLSIFSFSTFQTDTIIEGIGSTYYLFPQFGACDAPTGPLRCILDETLGFYSTGVAPSCDYISTDVPEIYSDQQNIKAVPIPFTDHLQFSVTNVSEKLSLIISDVTGREIFRRDNLNSDFGIETSSWPSGIYLLNWKQDHSLQTLKVVKQ